VTLTLPLWKQTASTWISEGLPLDITHYNTTDHLTGIMIEFGKYTLKYEPPGESPEDHSIEMSISSEATLFQMLGFFQSFLRAAGYEFDGKELCLERSAPDFDDIPEKWGADPGYFSCYPDGTPYQVQEMSRS